MIDEHDRDDVPRYLDADGQWRIPLAWQRFESRDQRIAMLVRVLERDARHRGARR